MTASLPAIERIVARPVVVPMRRPLQTSAALIGSAPLVLIDLHAGGIVGRSYLFAVMPLMLDPLLALLRALEPVLAGQPAVPADVMRVLRARFALFGTAGLVQMAMSGIDVAVWDIAAIAAGIPLARLLGGSVRPIPAYNSCGLGLIGAERARAEAAELADGFTALKVRLGYATLADDLDAVDAVRAGVPGNVAVMADYNQCLSVAEALRRGAALDDEGLTWIEEPVRADDYAGNAHVAAELRTAIQIGESFFGTDDMAKALAASACDLVMPDLQRIGGVSGWLRAAAQADAAGLPMSSHLFPEVSAHLMAVTPSAHWLEYVDWAAPILAEPVAVVDGTVTPRDVPGNGLAWDEDAVHRYAPAR